MVRMVDLFQPIENKIGNGFNLNGNDIILRTPILSDYKQWAALRESSRYFLKPFEPTWPKDHLTQTSFHRRLRRYEFEVREDLAYPFFIFSQKEELIGGVNLSHVRRDVVQACSLGYWMGAAFARKGIMSAAVSMILPFAFARLSLHRIEAACLPHNIASIRLLEKVGFKREGYARQYLYIDEKWQDHILYAMVTDSKTVDISLS